MTKTLRPGETRTFKSGPPNEGEYVVTQFAGHYETVFIPRLGPRQRMLDHEGVYEYEVPEAPLERLSDEEYWASEEHRNQYRDRMRYRKR